MKKTGALLLALVLAATLFAGCAQKPGQSVSVQAVSMIVGYGPLGQHDRFAGIVEAGRTFGVECDSELRVKELLVAVGDTVKAGDVLFVYDTDALALELEKRQIEYEQLENTITTKTAQITELEQERARASADAQIDYTLQIQELQLDINEAQLNLQAKQREIDRIQLLTENAEVRAENGGRVLSVNDPQSESYDPSKPYLTIAQTDTYRVKGVVNEQYAYSLSPGMPMLVRSRTDETLVWHGSIESVDLENPVQNEGNYYYYDGSGSEMTTASKYPFYIALEDDAGLMLGQHVYIEADSGEAGGLYLPASFLCDVDGAPYVWAAGSGDRLEKRSVTLGAYDADNDSWEIISGLALTDYIAFPDAQCAAGAAVVYYSEESFGGAEATGDYGEEYGEGYGYGEDDGFYGETSEEGFDGDGYGGGAVG